MSLKKALLVSLISIFLLQPQTLLAGWGNGFGSLIDDLRADVKNRIRELKGKNPQPNPNLKYQLPVSFLHVPEEKRDGDAAGAGDIEVWTMPRDKNKLALYYGTYGVEESLPWRLYCLICESKTVRHLNRLMATRKEPINIYVMVQEHVYGRDLEVVGYMQSRDAIIFPWKMPPEKEFYADLAHPERLRGLLLHEVAHSQDKTKFVQGGYGPDGSHSFNEITHRQMAYLEGWAYYNEALVSDDSYTLISGTVDRGCEEQQGKGYLKKERNKGQYEYINRPQLTFDDFIACEAFAAATFLAFDKSELLEQDKERDRMMAAWNATNESERDIVTVVKKYGELHPERAFGAATILDVLTDFSGPEELFRSFTNNGLNYLEARRAKIKRLWQAVGKNQGRISFAALAAGDIDGLIDIHLPDPEPSHDGAYIVEIIKARIKKRKETGERWDIKIPGSSDKRKCDPYVGAYVNGYQSPSPFLQTDSKRDDRTPCWSARGATKLSPQDKIFFYVFDKDKYNDDFIGECVSLSAEEIGAGGEYTFRNCGQVEELKVVIRAIKASDEEYMKLLGQDVAE